MLPALRQLHKPGMLESYRYAEGLVTPSPTGNWKQWKRKLEMENRNGQNLMQMNARVKPLINDPLLKTTSVRRPYNNYVPKMIHVDDLIQTTFQQRLIYLFLDLHLDLGFWVSLLITGAGVWCEIRTNIWKTYCNKEGAYTFYTITIVMCTWSQ